MENSSGQEFSLDDLVEQASSNEGAGKEAATTIDSTPMAALPKSTKSVEDSFNKQMASFGLLLNIANQMVLEAIDNDENLTALRGKRVSEVASIAMTLRSNLIALLEAIENGNNLNREYTKSVYDLMVVTKVSKVNGRDWATLEPAKEPSDADPNLKAFEPKFSQASTFLLGALFGKDDVAGQAVLDLCTLVGKATEVIAEASLEAYSETLELAVEQYFADLESKGGKRPHGELRLDQKVRLLIDSGIKPRTQEQVIAESLPLQALVDAYKASNENLLSTARVYAASPADQVAQADALALLDVSARILESKLTIQAG